MATKTHSNIVPSSFQYGLATVVFAIGLFAMIKGEPTSMVVFFMSIALIPLIPKAFKEGTRLHYIISYIADRIYSLLYAAIVFGILILMGIKHEQVMPVSFIAIGLVLFVYLFIEVMRYKNSRVSGVEAEKIRIALDQRLDAAFKDNKEVVEQLKELHNSIVVSGNKVVDRFERNAQMSLNALMAFGFLFALALIGFGLYTLSLRWA